MDNEKTGVDLSAIPAAEQRGYSRGYYAGRRRMIADQRQLDFSEKKADFWREVFVTALAEVVNGHGWRTGDTPITTVQERVGLAADFADEAVNYCHKALT